MAISNCLFSPTYENPHPELLPCIIYYISDLTKTTNYTQIFVPHTITKLINQ